MGQRENRTTTTERFPLTEIYHVFQAYPPEPSAVILRIHFHIKALKAFFTQKLTNYLDHLERG